VVFALGVDAHGLFLKSTIGGMLVTYAIVAFEAAKRKSS
jgi:hypothetical protein